MVDTTGSPLDVAKYVKFNGRREAQPGAVR
jgi:hypothetical protein